MVGVFFNGGHFSTCQTRKKSTPVTFFLHMRHVFLRPGVISLRRKMTPRSIFDGGRYSSLHRHHRVWCTSVWLVFVLLVSGISGIRVCTSFSFTEVSSASTIVLFKSSMLPVAYESKIELPAKVNNFAKNILKATALSFKCFASRLLKLYISFSMHLLPRMNVMLTMTNWSTFINLQNNADVI